MTIMYITYCRYNSNGEEHRAGVVPVGSWRGVTKLYDSSVISW